MGVLRLAVRGSEGVAVGGVRKPEDTGDVKQRPPGSAVCDVGDEQSATHVRYSPKISPKNILSLCLESAPLGCLTWQNRCPPVENELRHRLRLPTTVRDESQRLSHERRGR